MSVTQQEFDEINNLYKAKCSENSGLQAQIANLNNSIKTVQSNIAQITGAKKGSQLQIALDQVNALIQEKGQLTADTDQLRQNLQDSFGENAALQDEITRLKNEIQTLQSGVYSADQKAFIQKISSAYKIDTDDVFTLLGKLNDKILTSAQSSTQIDENSKAALTKQITDSQSLIQNMTKQISKIAVLAQLKSSNDPLDMLNQIAGHHLNNSSANNSKRIEQLEKQLDEQAQDGVQKDLKMQDYKQQIRDLNNKLKIAQDGLEQAQMQKKVAQPFEGQPAAAPAQQPAQPAQPAPQQAAQQQSPPPPAPVMTTGYTDEQKKFIQSIADLNSIKSTDIFDLVQKLSDKIKADDDEIEQEKQVVQAQSMQQKLQQQQANALNAKEGELRNQVGDLTQQIANLRLQVNHYQSIEEIQSLVGQIKQSPKADRLYRISEIVMSMRVKDPATSLDGIYQQIMETHQKLIILSATLKDLYKYEPQFVLMDQSQLGYYRGVFAFDEDSFGAELLSYVNDLKKQQGKK